MTRVDSGIHSSTTAEGLPALGGNASLPALDAGGDVFADLFDGAMGTTAEPRGPAARRSPDPRAAPKRGGRPRLDEETGASSSLERDAATGALGRTECNRHAQGVQRLDAGDEPQGDAVDDGVSLDATIVSGPTSVISGDAPRPQDPGVTADGEAGGALDAAAAAAATADGANSTDRTTTFIATDPSMLVSKALPGAAVAEPPPSAPTPTEPAVPSQPSPGVEEDAARAATDRDAAEPAPAPAPASASALAPAPAPAPAPARDTQAVSTVTRVVADDRQPLSQAVVRDPVRITEDQTPAAPPQAALARAAAQIAEERTAATSQAAVATETAVTTAEAQSTAVPRWATRVAAQALERSVRGSSLSPTAAQSVADTRAGEAAAATAVPVVPANEDFAAAPQEAFMSPQDTPVPGARTAVPVAQAAPNAVPGVAPVTGDAAQNGLGASVMTTRTGLTLETQGGVLPQVVQALRVLVHHGGASEARIQLKPEHLGALSVALRVENGAVTATINAEVPAVRQWLEAHASSLRQALADLGLQLERFVVQGDGESAHRDQAGQDEPKRQGRRRVPLGESATFEVTV